LNLCISVKRDIGQEILEGIQEIKAHKAGKKTLHTHTLKEPAAPQVIRAKLKLPQSTFAGLMGVSLRKVQDWEQRRRKPSGPLLFCCTLPSKSQKSLTTFISKVYRVHRYSLTLH